MTSHIKIRKAAGTWVVRAGGAVLGESKNALELTEGDYPAVIYFPRDDIGMAFLDRSEQTSHCPFKGDATYYSIVTKSDIIKNAASSSRSTSASISSAARALPSAWRKAAVTRAM